MGAFDDLINPTSSELEAIYAYVRAQRPKTKAHPAALPLIESFESWYQGLGITDWAFDVETLNEAKRRRNAINAALEAVIAPDWVPADAPQVAPPKGELAGLKESIEEAGRKLSDAPSQAVTLLKVGVVVGVGVVLFNLWRGTRVR
jgi:hypothetical protein